MRKLAPAVLILATATLLSGCIPGPTEVAPPAVKVDEVAVPDQMLPTGPYANMDSTIVPGVDGLPWLIGGSLAGPGEGFAPTVWTSPDGGAWEAKQIDPDFTGSFSGSIDASADLAALAGVTWTEGDSTSVLWTSTDREKWTSVALPDSFAQGFRFNDVAVSGTTVFGYGINPAGATQGILVKGDKVTEFALPEVGKGELLEPSQLVASGKNILLLASPGKEGDFSPAVTYVSDDSGKSWTDAAVVVERPSYVSGIAASEDGFVATGGATRDEASNATGPAAWFSADGTSWAAESVGAPPQDGPLFYSGSADAWLGAPQGGAVVSAVVSNDNAAVSGVYSRATGGSWTFAGSTGVNTTNGEVGIASSLDGQTYISVLGLYGSSRAGVLSGGSWTDTTQIAAREDVTSASTVYPLDEPIMTLYTSTFTVEPDLGWRNQTTYQLGQLSGDSLEEVPWDPERVAELSSVAIGTDGSGAEVLLGSYFPPGGGAIPVEGWFRSGPDEAWTPATGFPGDHATFFSSIERVGDLWVAVGTVRDSSAVADPEHGTIWTSPDGITWSNPAGEFGEGTLTSSVSDVCTLPDGTGVAVGWVEAKTSEYRPAVWMPVDGTWKRVDIGDLGESSGFGNSCATGEDGVIFAASVDSRDTLQRTTDGSTWDEVFRADRGITLGEPVAVPGGFAASGSLFNDSFSGPVAWLSADGTDWSPVSIPSYTAGSTRSVAPYGDDLIVTMDSRVGHPVSIIRDIKKAIADYTD